MQECSICCHKNDGKRNHSADSKICEECRSQIDSNNYVLMDRSDDEVSINDDAGIKEDAKLNPSGNYYDRETHLNDDNVIDMLKTLMSQEKQKEKELVYILKDQIMSLKVELEHKNVIINKLLERNELDQRDYNKQKDITKHIKPHAHIKPDNKLNTLMGDDENKFVNVTYRRKRANDKQRPSTNKSTLTLANKFQALLPVEIESEEDEFHESLEDTRQKAYNPAQFKRSAGTYRTVKEKVSSKVNHNASNKGCIYIDPYPERNKFPLKNVLVDIANIPREPTIKFKSKRNKVIIISDSIARRVDMREFNDLYNHGEVVKRAFPGATASLLNFYVKGTLHEDKPDTIIICGGTNNLTKKSQTVQETTKEIIDIAKTCHKAGVKKIFISSLICRPSYQNEIEEINKLLQYHASTYNYTLIDNSNISENHLWKDSVHLNEDGICILANNYLFHLNSHPHFNRSLPFNSIWED